MDSIYGPRKEVTVENRIPSRPEGYISTLTRKLFGTDNGNRQRISNSSFIGFSEILEKNLSEYQISGRFRCIHLVGDALFAYLTSRFDLRKVDFGRLDLRYGGTGEGNEKGIFNPVFSIAVENNRFVHEDPEETSHPALQKEPASWNSNIEACLNGLSEGCHIRINAGIANDPLDPEMFILTLTIVDSEISVGSSGMSSDDNDSWRYGGTGLGLYLTKRLLEEMHGRIRIRSSSVGLGTSYASTFMLRGSGTFLRQNGTANTVPYGCPDVNRQQSL